jgi:hypothetical protein
MNQRATCTGCGCDDFHACEGGCYWLRLDRADGKGVCSECPEHVEAWDRDDRTPHAPPIAELEAIAEGTLRIESPPRPPRKTAAGLCDHDWPFDEVRDGDCCRHCGMTFVRYIFTEAP